MIYTIGHKENYLKSIAANGSIQKLGRRNPGDDDRFPEGYEGGYAFQSTEDAQRRIDEAYPERGFEVFGLLTNWDNTEPSKNGWWNNLITDVEIVILGAD